MNTLSLEDYNRVFFTIECTDLRRIEQKNKVLYAAAVKKFWG